jgi:hypothetical protein
LCGGFISIRDGCDFSSNSVKSTIYQLKTHCCGDGVIGLFQVALMIYFVRAGSVNSVSIYIASLTRFFNCKLDFPIGFSKYFASVYSTLHDSYNLTMVAFK